MSTEFGTTLFRVPMFLKQGTAVDLVQDGTSQALTISVDASTIGDLIGGTTTTDYQESVRVVATGAITLYGTQTIDGVELAVDDRVLATAQVAGAANRIWTVQNTDWVIAGGWDVTDTITSGTVVPVEEGTTNAGKIAVLTTANPIVLGTTALTWTISDTSDVFISNFIGRTRSAASTTLSTAFAKNWVFATLAGAQTFTIPTHASQAHDIGTEIVIQHDAASGTKTIQCVSAAVSLNGTSNGSVTLTARGDAYILKKKSNNVWTAIPCKAGITGIAWGAITGTLSAQTDLQAALDAKQPLDTELTAIAALAVTDSNIIVGNGTTWVAESGATARTSLGVAIGTDVQAYSADLDAIAAAGNWKVFYTNGSGVPTELALGASGTVLQSNGATSAPTFETATGGSTQGKHTFWIPVTAMISSITGGAPITQVESTTNDVNVYVAALDGSVQENLQFSYAPPKRYNNGTVTFKAYWMSTATDTDGIALSLSGVALSDSDVLDTAFGTPVTVTDNAQSTAQEIYITSESAAVTIAGTPADEDIHFFKLTRDPSNGSDTMAEDLLLIGIKLYYTTDADTDA